MSRLQGSTWTRPIMRRDPFNEGSWSFRPWTWCICTIHGTLRALLRYKGLGGYWQNGLNLIQVQNVYVLTQSFIWSLIICFIVFYIRYIHNIQYILSRLEQLIRYGKVWKFKVLQQLWKWHHKMHISFWLILCVLFVSSSRPCHTIMLMYLLPM